MTNRNIILTELNELDSTLGNVSPQNLYSVPYGYFEGLPTRIMNRIKALEAADAKEELEYLSPLLSSISKETPYSVPDNYFQSLNESISYAINRADETSEEEIEGLSPLLSGLKNKNPYSVPAGYFDNLETKTEKKEATVITITKRRWYRLAVAAVFIGVIAIGALLIIANNSVSVNNPQAWVKKNVSKKVSEEKIDEFVTLVKDENNEKVDDTDASKQAEIKELMKDVPEKDIEEFLNDAVALESNNDTEGIMNE